MVERRKRDISIFGLLGDVIDIASEEGIDVIRGLAELTGREDLSEEKKAEIKDKKKALLEKMRK